MKQGDKVRLKKWIYSESLPHVQEFYASLEGEVDFSSRALNIVRVNWNKSLPGSSEARSNMGTYTPDQLEKIG